MSQPLCPTESEVIEAARRRHWSERLRAHVNECTECAGAVRVTEWLGGVAMHLGCHQPAPDPTYISLRADIERRLAETPVSGRQLRIVGLLGLTLGLAVAALTLTVWPTVSDMAGAWASTWSTASLVDISTIVTTWLGLPLFVVATYCCVLRPLR